MILSVPKQLVTLLTASYMVCAQNSPPLSVYRAAADRGSAVGQFLPGSAYYDGQGVAQDYTEAVRWVS